LLCFGQAVSRTTYSALFTIVSTTYGAGDGSTTFNLPDLRGRTVAGLDNMGGTAASRLTNAISGLTGTTLGAVGGDQRLQLHQHANTLTNNAVTSGAGSIHSHGNTLTNNAVTSGNHSVDHSHSGTTNNNSQTHTHTVTDSNVYLYTGNLDYGNYYNGYYPTTTTQTTSANNVNHAHSFGTGGASVGHNHSVTSNVTISNANESAHTHSVTSNVTISNIDAGAGASQNVQPTIILNYIIKV
jgi:microcystin-dependent protein